MNAELRQRLLQTALDLNSSGLSLGTSGNVSVRCDDDMLITPSGVPYAALGVDDMVQMDLDGAFKGSRTPSSEWYFHAAIYRQREDAAAIVHAHPTFATSLACMHWDIPAFHYEVALAGGHNIRCSRYATFGTPELADHVVHALRGRRACLVANHGLICLGQDPERALGLALRVEQLAMMYCQCVQTGEPQILGEEEMQRVLEKFRDYGQ